MGELTLITAFKCSENTVKVVYRHNELSTDFIIEWNNINPSTGDIEHFELQTGCMSKTDELNEIIDDAINAGEESSIYIELRDSFDRSDCEQLYGQAYTVFDYIKTKFSGKQIDFAKAVGVEKQQVTKWIRGDFIIIDDSLYSKRREILAVD